MVRRIIFHIFNLSDIISSDILIWIDLAWWTMSRVFMLSLVYIANQLSGIHLLFCLQLRNIWTLWSCILMTPLRFHILWLNHFIIFFLRSSFTTLSVSLLISLPSGISRCYIGGVHALFSSMLLNDKRVVSRCLQVIGFFSSFIKFYKKGYTSEILLYLILVYFDSGF